MCGHCRRTYLAGDTALAGDSLSRLQRAAGAIGQTKAAANRGADHAEISTTHDLPAPTAPPGWYPSPNDPTRQQWWDGQGWTEPISGSEYAATMSG
ncbi:DUF2510 domain-containing protein [Nocardia sp. NPDC004604]|uniref:DUF2510 domain-containing protein n=1 Tax=Nocardia sp. NPDC004604 TaxID=3157013 RepID=UPI0033A6AB1C